MTALSETIELIEKAKIPADIMKAARDALADAMGGSYSFDAFATVLAKVIFAERQRCAGIAYRVCAETRHVTLGDKVRDAINTKGQADE